METEYEAKFLDIDKDEVRTRLEAAGAVLERPEFGQRRWVFDLPEHNKNNFARVRDEGGIFTMTVKRYTGAEKDHPEESEVVVDSFDNAVDILTVIGCIPRSYQENRRELWTLDDVKITIDSWPFLEPFVEVEGASEGIVEEASKKCGFDWSKALFKGVNPLYQMIYGEHVHIREMPRLTFDMPNPFH
jgi:adenylate cyclase class 2